MDRLVVKAGREVVPEPVFGGYERLGDFDNVRFR